MTPAHPFNVLQYVLLCLILLNLPLGSGTPGGPPRPGP